MYSIVQAVIRVQVTSMMNWTKSVKSEIYIEHSQWECHIVML
jgi:hypothetical protein